MARLDVKATITAPDEIQIPLVRADQLHTSNVFRVAFEICLAATASLLGVMLSITVITAVHWAFFSFSGGLCIVFLVLSLKAITPIKQVAGNGS